MTFATTSPRSHVNSAALLERNQRVIPGGLASINRRADPCIAFVRAKGSRLWDADGNEYVDYHAGFAPYLLGHNDPDQNAAVIAAVESERSNYGSGPTEDEGELAQTVPRVRAVRGQGPVLQHRLGGHRPSHPHRPRLDRPRPRAVDARRLQRQSERRSRQPDEHRRAARPPADRRRVSADSHSPPGFPNRSSNCCTRSNSTIWTLSETL